MIRMTRSLRLRPPSGGFEMVVACKVHIAVAAARRRRNVQVHVHKRPALPRIITIACEGHLTGGVAAACRIRKVQVHVRSARGHDRNGIRDRSLRRPWAREGHDTGGSVQQGQRLRCSEQIKLVSSIPCVFFYQGAQTEHAACTETPLSQAVQSGEGPEHRKDTPL